MPLRRTILPASLVCTGFSGSTANSRTCAMGIWLSKRWPHGSIPKAVRAFTFSVRTPSRLSIGSVTTIHPFHSGTMAHNSLRFMIIMTCRWVDYLTPCRKIRSGLHFRLLKHTQNRFNCTRSILYKRLWWVLPPTIILSKQLLASKPILTYLAVLLVFMNLVRLK